MSEKTNTIKKIFSSYRKIPEKKQYVEFFTAILSVPVLITVIMLNINNLKTNNKQTPSPTPQIKEEKIYVTVGKLPNSTDSNSSSNTRDKGSSTQSTSQPCKQDIGPISIKSPEEGENITDNPVVILVDYKTGEYCSVVWAYRVNGGTWSSYDNKSIALFNLPQGKIKLDLKVKSIVSDSEQTLTKSFIYQGSSISLTPDISQEVKGSSVSAK